MRHNYVTAGGIQRSANRAYLLDFKVEAGVGIEPAYTDLQTDLAC